jgi:hypothetical protein
VADAPRDVGADALPLSPEPGPIMLHDPEPIEQIWARVWTENAALRAENERLRAALTQITMWGCQHNAAEVCQSCIALRALGPASPQP